MGGIKLNSVCVRARNALNYWLCKKNANQETLEEFPKEI